MTATQILEMDAAPLAQLKKLTSARELLETQVTALNVL